MAAVAVKHLGAREALALATVILACGLTLWPRETTYHLSLETERLEVRLAPEHRGAWRFHEVRIFRGFSTAGEPFDGTLEALPGTEVLWARSATGDLRLRCLGPPGREVARLRRPGAPIESIRGRLVVVIDEIDQRVRREGTLVYPLRGSGRLGGEIRQDNGFGTPVLRSGEISWTERTLLGRTAYVAGQLALDRGDVIEIEPEHPLAGAVIVDEGPAMQGIFDLSAPRLEVRRASASGLRLSTSWLALIRHDPSVQLAWSATLVLLGWSARWRQRHEEASAASKACRSPRRSGHRLGRRGDRPARDRRRMETGRGGQPGG